ncbi:MinD/ParA family protein [Anaeromicropila populeti]|uniref:Flagellar biosynthesis protein FlhG n=1 Tax=Anaeromicropila populeti TaxID=37658 RepID=A0A1I6KXJ0_9FIRM|nr:MinD/ParA family protein [Anaeromicropila populeti]SFR95925.1 flagellar biosynthesis protein FlhG [Anaeromicropila populeti]
MDQASQLRKMISSQSQPGNFAKVVTITSGKGGVGKSNISVNLAIHLRRLGNRVIILDADFGLANVEVMFGVRPSYNLSDLIFKGKDLKEIITDGPEGIGIISGGSGIQEMANLTKYQISNLTGKLSELDEMADIIIIDTGAGISDSVIEFATYSSELILIATPEPTSITDAYALLKTLNKKDEYNKEKAIKMITNRVESIKEGKELFVKLNTVVGRFLDVKLEHLGSVPQDANVSKAVMRQTPFSIAYPNSVAAKAISELAEMIQTNEVYSQKNRKGIHYLFSNLFGDKDKMV